MKIGVDLDGTISRLGLYNPSLRLPGWLFFLLFPLVVLISPNKKRIEKLRELKNKGDEIIVISARPAGVAGLTESWLKFHKVPFDKLFCVGFGKGTKQRKLEVIKKEGVGWFFDDDKRLVEFFNQNSIKTTTNFD